MKIERMISKKVLCCIVAASLIMGVTASKQVAFASDLKSTSNIQTT